MADVMPNYRVERMRIELQIKELEANLFRGEIRLVEMEFEKNKIQENQEATKIAIEQLVERLSGIINETD